MHEASISEKREQHQAVRLNSIALGLCKCRNPDARIIYPIYGAYFRGVAHEFLVMTRGMNALIERVLKKCEQHAFLTGAEY